MTSHWNRERLEQAKTGAILPRQVTEAKLG
jgi:hypothetical protein